jgi:hypothetical protein
MSALVTAWSTLRRRDPHNQTVGIFLLLGLAHASKQKSFEGIKAYTVWNCLAVLFNFSFRQRWERSLVCNSLAIWASYRTASADAHADLVARAGYSEPVYHLGDQIIHTMPVLALMHWLVKHERYIRPQHGALSLIGHLFFVRPSLPSNHNADCSHVLMWLLTTSNFSQAYSQAGQLDVGKIYVPHDVTFAWTAVGLGHLLAPAIGV